MSLARHFIAFRNEFNKFIKTGARMLATIYYMILNLAFWHENVKIYASLTLRHKVRHYVTLLNLY